jgi:hypothetical protein
MSAVNEKELLTITGEQHEQGETHTEKLSIPVMPGFRSRILPVLIAYWVGTAVFTWFGQPIALVLGSWATVTTIMLWPVGRPLGREYASYRTAWFVVGVASMVGIPFFGYFIIASTDASVKMLSLLGLAVDIGVWGIPLSAKGAFSRPFPMLFRPDLIFADGRLLAGGIVGIGLGMKFIFTNAPPGSIPVGNWYALFSVIILALVQIIPLRGMWKMRNRISRLLFDKWSGFWVTAAKEFYLILAVAALMFSFHNFFGGVIPFTRNVLAGNNEGLALMAAFALFTVLVRAWYKKNRIGDPFIIETRNQSLVKNTILAVGLIGFVYGYLHVMLGGFPRTPNAGSDFYLTILGTAMLVWGLVLLVPVRAWAQMNQRQAMLRQMVQVVLPRLDDESRFKVVGRVIRAVSGLPDEGRIKIVKDMTSFLREMEDGDREKVMKTQLQVLSALEPHKRMAMMKAMDQARMN